MDPVTRSDHVGVYKGEREEDGRTVLEGVGDLGYRRDKVAVGENVIEEIVSHWKPTDEELAILNMGGHVELGIMFEPIPPVRLEAVEAIE